MTLDSLIEKCKFNEKQTRILNYYQQGYTERDIAALIYDDEEKNSEIHRIINTCVKKIKNQNDVDYLYDYIYWSKKKTTESWKQCSKCKEWKSDIDFYKENKGRDGFRPECKKCK